MKLQRKIVWIALIISGIALTFFILFSTALRKFDYNEIFSNISISIFGSSLLVFVPALVTFQKNKSEAKQKIISELIKVENLVNSVHFQTTFLKGVDGQYSLDFSFEKTKYELAKDFPSYTAHKDIYEIKSKRVEKLYDTISAIDHYDYTLLDTCLADYVRIWGKDKLINELFKKHFEILNNFMIRSESSAIEYGARQYKACNASIGTFFDIWFKKFLVELEPIDKKLEYLYAIKNIMKLRFYRASYRTIIKSKDQSNKISIKENIEQFYRDNNIKKPRFIIKFLRSLEETSFIKRASNKIKNAIKKVEQAIKKPRCRK